MKSKFILFTIIAMLSLSAFGQNSEKGSIGLSYSFGNGISFNPFVSGSASYTMDVSTIGITYLNPFKKSIEWETGLYYSLFPITRKPSSMLGLEETSSKMTLIDIPFGIRTTFAEYLFVNTGLFMGLQLNNSGTFDSQSGIGLYGGLGGKYDFKAGWSIFLNPYFKFHSAIPFTEWTHHARLLEYGIKVGVMYRL